MPDGSIIVYLYDGSFDGFLCCADESIRRGETPEAVLLEDEGQGTLFPQRSIPSDRKRAAGFIRRVADAMGPDALLLVKRGFLTCLEDRELWLLAFLRLGFRLGRRVMRRLTDPAVAALTKAVRHLGNETEALRGFLRFSDLEGVLVAVVEPKNQVLPLLSGYLTSRYPDECLLVYDRTHRACLLCDRGRARLGYLDEFEPALPGRTERNYRALWQSFYEAIAIRERYNPRCRMSHMPKRYWAYMTEFWEREVYRPEAMSDTEKKDRAELQP